MRNTFSWRHVLALGVMVCLLSIVAGAVLSQEPPPVEPDAVDAPVAVPAFQLDAATGSVQEVTLDTAAPLASGAYDLQGDQATGLSPDGVWPSETPPVFSWTAELGSDTEEMFFYLYDGLVLDDGTIVPDGGVNTTIEIDPLTPTCSIAGTTANCSLTLTQNFPDGTAYYWEVTSEEVSDGDVLSSAGTHAGYNQELVYTPPASGPFDPSFDVVVSFDANAGDLVTIAGEADGVLVGSSVQVRLYDILGVQLDSEGPFVSGAPPATASATINSFGITENGKYFARISGFADGDFRLTIDEEATLGDAPTSVTVVRSVEVTASISYNDTILGVEGFGPISGQNVYSFTAGATDDITVSVDNTLGNPAFAASFAIGDSAGNLVYASGAGNPITENVGVLGAGTYYISVNADGLYALSIDDAATLATDNVIVNLPPVNSIDYNQQIVFNPGLAYGTPLFSFEITQELIDNVAVNGFTQGVYIDGEAFDSSNGSGPVYISIHDATTLEMLDDGLAPQYYMDGANWVEGTYIINVGSNNSTAGDGLFDTGTYTVELQNVFTENDDVDTVTTVLDTTATNTTIANAGFVVDVPKVYPDAEDVYTTTPIFTWPEIAGVQWYRLVAYLPGTGAVPWDMWYEVNPAAPASAFETAATTGVLCSDGQCRIRPDQQLTQGLGDTDVQLWVQTWDGTSIGDFFLLSDFTIVAPLVRELEDNADQETGVPGQGRPYYTVLNQSVEAENMFGVLDSDTDPDYYRVIIVSDATGQVVSDQWYEKSGCTPDTFCALMLYTDVEFGHGLQDTMPNGDYTYYVQGYADDADAYTPFTTGRSFSIAEDAPDQNDLVIGGIYDYVDDQADPFDLNSGGDVEDFTSTWQPCAPVDDVTTCTQNRPIFHFGIDLDDYSGDWVGIRVVNTDTNAQVFQSWYNRYTEEKFENGAVVSESQYLDSSLDPYYTNSNWVCDVDDAGDTIPGFEGLGFDFTSCFFQPLGDAWFMPNGFNYEVSVASFGVGGFSGFTTAGDVRTDPFGAATFTIEALPAVQNLSVDTTGAPLTATRENMPVYLTETLVSGEPKISWAAEKTAQWYNITISSGGSEVFNQWYQPNRDAENGWETTWPGNSINDGGWEVLDSVNNNNGAPQSSNTVEGLWCSSATTSQPDFVDNLPDVDVNPVIEGDAFFNDLFIGAGESLEFTVYGFENAEFDVVVSSEDDADWSPEFNFYDVDGSLIANVTDDDGDATTGEPEDDDGDAEVIGFVVQNTGIHVLEVVNNGSVGAFFDIDVDHENLGPNPALLAPTGDPNGDDVFTYSVPLTQDRFGILFPIEISLETEVVGGTPNVDPEITLFAPDGTQIATDDNSGGDPEALLENLFVTEEGVYTVVLQNNGTAAGTVNVIITSFYAAADGINPSGTDISYNTSVTNQGLPSRDFTTGDIPTNSYVFYGQAGDVFDVIVQSDFDEDLQVELLAPDRTTVIASDDQNSTEDPGDVDTIGDAGLRLVTLTEDGFYTIVVGNKSYSANQFDLFLVGKDIAQDYYAGTCGFSLTEATPFIGFDGSYSVSVSYYNGGISEAAETTFDLNSGPASAPAVDDGVLAVYNNETLTGTTRPIFRWQHVQGNTWYRVNLSGPSGDQSTPWRKASEICNYEFHDVGESGDVPFMSDDDVLNLVCDLAVENFGIILSGGDYSWTVDAFGGSSGTDIATSSAASFTVSGADTGAPTAVWPPASTTATDLYTLTFTNRPEYFYFAPAENAAWYLMYLAPTDDLGSAVWADWIYSPKDNSGSLPSSMFGDSVGNQYDNVCEHFGDFPFGNAVDLDGDFYNTPGIPRSVVNVPIASGATVSYDFEITAGTIIDIAAFETFAANPVDLSLELIGPNNEVVASDDDSSSILFGDDNPFLNDFLVPYSGLYTINITNKAATDADNDPLTPDVPTVDGEFDFTLNFTGQIPMSADEQFFNFFGPSWNLWAGPDVQGNATYIAPDVDYLCEFYVGFEYIDEGGFTSFYDAEFLRNTDYSWWALPFGPTTPVPLTNWELLGEFAVDIPAPELVEPLFGQIEATLAAGETGTYTFELNAGSGDDDTYFSYDPSDATGGVPVTIQVFGPGDDPATAEPLQSWTGTDTTGDVDITMDGEDGVYTIAVTNNDPEDAVAFELYVGFDRGYFINNFTTEVLSIFFLDADGEVVGTTKDDMYSDIPVDGSATTLAFFPVIDEIAYPQWYKIEITDLATDTLVYDQWVSREAALCDTVSRPITNPYISTGVDSRQPCLVDITGVPVVPYGTYEIVIAPWGQGSDVIEGPPYYGASAPEDNVDTDFNEGVVPDFSWL